MEGLGSRMEIKFFRFLEKKVRPYNFWTCRSRQSWALKYGPLGDPSIAAKNGCLVDHGPGRSNGEIHAEVDGARRLTLGREV